MLITGQQWEEDAWMAPSSRIDSRYSYTTRHMQPVSCGRHGWPAGFRVQVPVQQLLLALVQEVPCPQVPARGPVRQQIWPGVVQVTGTQVPVAAEHVVHVGQVLGVPPWQVPLLQV